MKQFIYDVAGNEFTTTEAFGETWKEVKALATELHAAIYRTVIKGDEERREVYAKGGCFLWTSIADPNSVKIW